MFKSVSFGSNLSPVTNNCMTSGNSLYFSKPGCLRHTVALQGRQSKMMVKSIRVEVILPGFAFQFQHLLPCHLGQVIQ